MRRTFSAESSLSVTNDRLTRRRFLRLALSSLLIPGAGLMAPKLARAESRHLRSDGRDGFYTEDHEHIRSDGRGGYYMPDHEHVRSDGRGGFYTEDHRHYRSDGRDRKSVV